MGQAPPEMERAACQGGPNPKSSSKARSNDSDAGDNRKSVDRSFVKFGTVPVRVYEQRFQRRAFKPAAKQIGDINKLIRHRYGDHLPMTDDTWRFAVPIARCYFALNWSRAERNFKAWCQRTIPDATASDIDRWIQCGQRQPVPLTPDKLAECLNVRHAEQQRLGLKMIGAVDVSKEERNKLKARRDAAAKKKRRHDAGAKPREFSLARTRPWDALGISRTEYFERKLNKMDGLDYFDRDNTGVASNLLGQSKQSNGKAETDAASVSGKHSPVPAVAVERGKAPSETARSADAPSQDDAVIFVFRGVGALLGRRLRVVSSSSGTTVAQV
jgi:hypothetical protein